MTLHPKIVTVEFELDTQNELHPRVLLRWLLFHYISLFFSFLSPFADEMLFSCEYQSEQNEHNEVLLYM